jgi:hypothetical protein
MLTSTKFVGALVIGGIVAAGGSAFTAASTIDSGQKYVGAVSQAISGVHVSSVNYTVDTSDKTTAVAFHVTEVLAAADTVTATISDGAVTTPVTDSATCAKTAGTSGGTDLLCSFTTGVTNVQALTIRAA